MSDIFETDIDNEDENLEALEDSDISSVESENLDFDFPLYCTKLDYSCETIYAKTPEKMTLKAGDFVIIPTRYGKDMARVLGCSKKPMGIKQADIVTIERKASEEDLKRKKELEQKEKDAFPIFKEKVALHKLDMKLIQTHFLFEEQKALFFFSSDSRVDFRDLVKDLVAVFRLRIELRQIGVRDEARITGGLGVCGRAFCCHGLSDKLKPVSIKMAKDQNLSLNSMKISGQCGRLLCCLSYEFDWYNEARRNLPGEGIRIHYDGTDFRITEVNPLTSMIKMIGEDGRLLEVNAKRFYKDNNKWKIN
ncbi:MAG: regulatory iron-sulfur-containing complex subunit RicT [Spirochaetales bacterium]|nr:regulatory iron-sulfur-containing complex subunit RicT [Spirochaetales bacterium]